jgi:hypothetical protein
MLDLPLPDRRSTPRCQTKIDNTGCALTGKLSASGGRAAADPGLLCLSGLVRGVLGC